MMASSYCIPANAGEDILVESMNEILSVADTQECFGSSCHSLTGLSLDVLNVFVETDKYMQNNSADCRTSEGLYFPSERRRYDGVLRPSVQLCFSLCRGDPSAKQSLFAILRSQSDTDKPTSEKLLTH